MRIAKMFVAMVMAVAVFGAGQQAKAEAFEPVFPQWVPTLYRVVTTYAPTSTITQATTVNQAVSSTALYNFVDIQVTAQISTAGYITITPQFSNDGTNWADARFRGVWLISDVVTLVDTSYVFYLNRTSNGTSSAYARIPVALDRMQLNIVMSVPTNGVITPTVKTKLVK